MASDPPTMIYVSAKRRDGKYPVRFYFPISGRQLNKVMSKDALDATIAEWSAKGTDFRVMGYGVVS